VSGADTLPIGPMHPVCMHATVATYSYRHNCLVAQQSVLILMESKRVAEQLSIAVSREYGAHGARLSAQLLPALLRHAVEPP